MEKTMQVEVLSIQHKMSLPPAFLLVYVNHAITHRVLHVCCYWAHNATLWTAMRTFDRVARIEHEVSIQCKQCHGKEPRHWQLRSSCNTSIETPRATLRMQLRICCQLRIRRMYSNYMEVYIYILKWNTVSSSNVALIGWARLTISCHSWDIGSCNIAHACVLP